MADKRFLGHSAGVNKAFISEDGKHYRATRQDMAPIIQRVESFKEKVNEAPKATNRHGWHYAGSVPLTMITDYIHRRGYTFDQFARNDGGIKDDFMAYFNSRDFCKLHTNHVTTKKERSHIVVPEIGKKS